MQRNQNSLLHKKKMAKARKEMKLVPKKIKRKK